MHSYILLTVQFFRARQHRNGCALQIQCRSSYTVSSRTFSNNLVTRSKRTDDLELCLTLTHQHQIVSFPKSEISFHQRLRDGGTHARKIARRKLARFGPAAERFSGPPRSEERRAGTAR